MNFNQFTIKSQEVIQQAQQLTQEMGHQQIEPEHLFVSMLEHDPDVTPYLLKKLNVNIGLISDIAKNNSIRIQSLAQKNLQPPGQPRKS